jgi:hypothetical protein
MDVKLEIMGDFNTLLSLIGHPDKKNQRNSIIE